MTRVREIESAVAIPLINLNSDKKMRKKVPVLHMPIVHNNALRHNAGYIVFRSILTFQKQNKQVNKYYFKKKTCFVFFHK